MGFIELAKKRYSVRKFEKTRVEDEKLQKILEAAKVAPTAANKQPQRILVVREESSLKKIKLAANIYGAPLAIIICAELTECWVRSYDEFNSCDVDTSIITDHMMLEATDLGIGSLWVCAFDPDILRREFAIPGNYRIVNILALGYAAGEIKSPDRHDQTRKPLSQTVFYEKF